MIALVSIPHKDKSFRVTRVSSHASMSALANASAARGRQIAKITNLRFHHQQFAFLDHHLLTSSLAGRMCRKSSLLASIGRLVIDDKLEKNCHHLIRQKNAAT